MRDAVSTGGSLKNLQMASGEEQRYFGGSGLAGCLPGAVGGQYSLWKPLQSSAWFGRGASSPGVSLSGNWEMSSGCSLGAAQARLEREAAWKGGGDRSQETWEFGTSGDLFLPAAVRDAEKESSLPRIAPPAASPSRQSPVSREAHLPGS